jgi:putative acetyltransferase
VQQEPTIRCECPDDIPAIHAVIKEAFGRPDEADLVDALRASGALALSLVADVGGRIVGHVGFSPITIGGIHHALALAPVAVAPPCQRRGIGAALVRRGLEQCRDIPCPVVVVLGEPAYYNRFGFIPASAYGISCPFPVPDEVYMALKLAPGEGRDCRGVVRYRPEFESVT